ncbi:hypothetical protein BLA29_003646 [Euroglyphus maynei]|uniref:Uncharacterized protein n=1 Tax=Euroglyphus maynei TaxID=6958 RepID=A0A1Y3BPG9_EURMA|nr:hypothetical protein BLA29_003646 [Euroglyphus maynei]
MPTFHMTEFGQHALKAIGFMFGYAISSRAIRRRAGCNVVVGQCFTVTTTQSIRWRGMFLYDVSN